MTPSKLLLGGAAALTLVACSATVRVEPPTPTGRVAEDCVKLESALPRTVDGLIRAESEPHSPYVAVWGAGEITVRCGVDRPAKMAPTDNVTDVNGVGWYADPQKPALFTTVNREAYVEVTIAPTHQVGAVLVELADPIKATIP
ncbi:DUF3515 domain-containing protein [Acrocarpospora catenulata]|uniref:DUF3515 domain-containing protein n=1 Tax=Acrocarpospora catenulata TaxID=2836182 RepID=UPI001BD9B3F2|nr:DUF3515 domain-containing protein [Acrocarpospora catenulata]